MTILRENAPAALLGLLCVSFAVIPAIITVNLIYRWTSDAALPASLPWAGVPANGGRLGRLRANLTSLFHMKTLLDEGYNEYSKHGQVYVLPHLLTGPEVVLPLSQVRWLVEQPDSLLNQTEVNRQFLEADHTFLHPNIVREPVHPEVIKRELTHKLSSFSGDIVDELQSCLEENWGTDTENWREVEVYDTMLDVISRLSTRVFVGLPLSRNKEFLHSARMFDKNVVLSAAALNIIPGFLKTLLAPILTAYDHAQYLTLAKFVLPSISQRLEQLEQLGKEQLPRFDGEEHNDYIQWAIGHALAHWDPLELTATVIARRLACLCFAAIQSSVISITNTLFDIASSPNCAEYLNTMRDEVLAESGLNPQAMSVTDAESTSVVTTPGNSMEPALPSNSGLTKSTSSWGKAALARMVHVDSTLRESMRLNGFVARGIMKMVTAPGGVTLPCGSHIPQGTKVGIQAYSVHRDEELFWEAEIYNAFRFVPGAIERRTNHHDSDSGMGERARATGSDNEDSGGHDTIGSGARGRGPRQPQALVSTSPTFLAFSHGPNACPGRFFAANQLKLTLAHIALHYEIEPITRRPANKWFAGSMAPPMRETLRVRRRRV